MAKWSTSDIAGIAGMMAPHIDRDAAQILAGYEGERRALFLDRDGVININHGYVHRAEDTEFVDGIFDACRVAKELNFLLVVATNQAGIARGYYSQETFLRYTQWLHDEFRTRGVPLLATYYCPHHPDFSSPNEVDGCLCRKPAPGMILAAAEDFSIELSKSAFIGDMDSDMQAASSAGIGARVKIGALTSNTGGCILVEDLKPSGISILAKSLRSFD